LNQNTQYFSHKISSISYTENRNERRNINSSKNEQRTFMMKGKVGYDLKLDIDKQKEFSPWYTVEK